MPELPEVETVRRTLAPRLAGRRVQAVAVAAADAVGRPAGDPEALARGLRGLVFLPPGRRGKYLFLPLAEGAGGPPRRVLVVHLRMTGRLQVCPGGQPPEPHTHVRLALDDGRELRFRDVRRFGRLYLFRAHELGRLLAEACGIPAAAAGAGEDGGRLPADAPPGLRQLGPEPFAPEAEEALAAALARRRAPVKAVLLDQRVLAGVGNIYADEALHRAGIHPATPAAALGRSQARDLLAALRQVLAEAVAAGGTSVRDYVDGQGRPGAMQERLRVYGRAGRPCPACGTPVAKATVAGRGSHFCPRCQPPP